MIGMGSIFFLEELFHLTVKLEGQGAIHFIFLFISGSYAVKLENIPWIGPFILQNRGQICHINSLTGTAEIPKQV